MGRGGVLEHEDAVGDWFEVEEGSAGGLPVLSTVAHMGGRRPVVLAHAGGQESRGAGWRAAWSQRGAHGGNIHVVSWLDAAGTNEMLTVDGSDVSCSRCYTSLKQRRGCRSLPPWGARRWQPQRSWMMLWWLVRGRMRSTMSSRDGRHSEMKRGTKKGRASWLCWWAAVEDKDSRSGGARGSGEVDYGTVQRWQPGGVTGRPCTWHGTQGRHRSAVGQAPGGPWARPSQVDSGQCEEEFGPTAVVGWPV
jgi:hypothetical protein